jgi:gluconate 2-dehydrogenase gamma chain
MGDRQPAERGGMRRRELLRRAGVLGAVATVPATAAPAPAAAPEREQLKAFAAAESDTLNAVLARLIPSDGTPGATEARVGRYIDGQLAGDQKAAAPLYEIGLAALDEHSRGKHGASFVQLDAAKQDDVLRDVEAGRAQGFVPNARVFFATLREHALQGMFSDPVHGGNAAFTGWDLLGYPGIKLRFSAAEQKIGTRVRRAHRSTADYEIFNPQAGSNGNGRAASGGGHHGH